MRQPTIRGKTGVPMIPGTWFPVPRRLTRELGCQLGASGIATYVVIASFANREGEAFPSTRTIAHWASLDPVTVRRKVQQLVALGLIEKHPRRSNEGDQTSHLFVLRDLVGVRESATQGERIGNPPVSESATPNERVSERDSSKFFKPKKSQRLTKGTAARLDLPTVFEHLLRKQRQQTGGAR